MDIADGVLENAPINYQRTPNRGSEINPTVIVLHDTAGTSFQGAIDWLCDPKARASAHIVISRKGEICQLCNFNVKAWHAGRSSFKGKSGVNAFGIGIELDNPGRLERASRSKVKHWAGRKYRIKWNEIEEKETEYHGNAFWMPYTEKQLDALQLVCSTLVDVYPLIEDITTHWAIAPGRKVDTNPLFPLSHFRAKVLGRRDDINRATLLKGAKIRKWPSFYENIVDEVESSLPVEIIREGVFEVKPRQRAGKKEYKDWALVEHSADAELRGWVLKEEMEL